MTPAMCIRPLGFSSSDLSRKKHHVSSLVLAPHRAKRSPTTRTNQKRLGCIALVGALFLFSAALSFEATPLYDAQYCAWPGAPLFTALCARGGCTPAALPSFLSLAPYC